MSHKTPYVALYGNVKIEKQWCADCDGYSFVVDGKLVCCDTPVGDLPERYKRESQPEDRRQTLKKSDKEGILARQEDRCFYCGRTFGSIVYRKARPTILRVNFDHMVPYSLTMNNNPINIVAACQICNGIKSDFCFQTLEEAQIYILGKWQQKGIV
jgi:hypothetical protein